MKIPTSKSLENQQPESTPFLAIFQTALFPHLLTKTEKGIEISGDCFAVTVTSQVIPKTLTNHGVMASTVAEQSKLT